MIEVTTTAAQIDKAIDKVIKQTIIGNLDELTKEAKAPFFYENFMRDATLLKEQIIESLSVELSENFPKTFIASDNVTKKSLQKALSINFIKGEIQLIKEELEIDTSSFKKKRDFWEEDALSEEEWQEDFEDINSLTEEGLNDMFETDSEEEEETKMYDFIEQRIKDKNKFLTKLKNSNSLKRLNLIWI